MLLSIIIPIYNVEAYVARCLESILTGGAAANDEVEVIVVDDGSPDGSMEIVVAIAARHTNITILRQTNQGLSAARNAALAIARGKYIWFVDSDDYAMPGAVTDLLAIARSHGEEVLVFDTSVISEGDTFSSYILSPFIYHRHHHYYGSTHSGYFFHGKIGEGLVQRNLFLRSFLTAHALTFTPGLYHEDIEFVTHVMACAQTVLPLRLTFYVYRIRTAGSIMSTAGDKHQHDMLAILRLFIRRADEAPSRYARIVHYDAACRLACELLYPAEEPSPGYRRFLASHGAELHHAVLHAYQHSLPKADRRTSLYALLIALHLDNLLVPAYRRTKAMLRCRGVSLYLPAHGKCNHRRAGATKSRVSPTVLAPSAKPPLRVLFVTHCTVMGGANRSLLQMVKELKAMYGVDPVVLAPTLRGEDPGIIHKCHEEGIPCIQTHYYSFKKKRTLKSVVSELMNILLFYPAIVLRMRHEHFDLVHSNSSVTAVGAMISRAKRLPHVWHLREYGIIDFGLYPIFGRWYERLMYSMGDCFIAISKRMKEVFLDSIPEEKIVLSYNGIDASTYSIMAEHGHERTQFVMVGAVSEAKGQLEAVKALAMLKAQGYDACLTIIGDIQTPSYGEAIRAVIVDNGMEDMVILAGGRDDVPDILPRMDVGLMLSRCEAFGRVTVEYMLQGLAVIASDTGANPEIVEDGVTGLLYPYGDINALAACMKALIDRRDDIPSMAARGHRRVIDNFLSTRNTTEVYGVYKELIKQNNVGMHLVAARQFFNHH